MGARRGIPWIGGISGIRAMWDKGGDLWDRNSGWEWGECGVDRKPYEVGGFPDGVGETPGSGVVQYQGNS